MVKKKQDSQTGFIQLKPKPGGLYDQFVQKRKVKQAKIPKDPDKYLDLFTDQYGTDAIANMQEIDIGDYVYQKGITHSLNMNVGRNIPWIEDGLKAVERRILYMMYKGKLYNGKFDKVAGITGDMIKYVHPHGEQSANDSIYRLGRKRTIMIPYIKAGGNFGNMEDMKPAAPRYASASLSDYAMACFFSEMGTKYQIFDMKDNYKYSDKEPVFITSRFPNILMQWNQGIGKGAATYLGAFNSKELLAVAIKMLDDPNCKVKIYPDTPAPVDIINKSELKKCFDLPAFKVKMRSKYYCKVDKCHDDKGNVVDKYTVVFTSLPVGVSGQTIRNEIIALREKDLTVPKSKQKIPEVLNVEIAVNDRTPGGIELVVSYEKGYDPEALAEKLFRSTSLGKTIGVQYVLISDNKPDVYTPRQILNRWITQRFDQKRRYYHQQALKAAKDRARLEAICTILSNSNNIDKAISLIKSSKTEKDAIQALMKEFKFTEFQAVSVIQIQLRNLPKLNIDETKAERDKALADYKHYRKILSDDTAIKESIRSDLQECLNKYAKDRNADVIDLKESGAGFPEDEKYVIYTEDGFMAVPTTEAIKQMNNNDADRTSKFAHFQNQDTVALISKDGSVKILDGYAFTISYSMIRFDQLGVNKICNMIIMKADQPLPSYIATLTNTGYGKLLEYADFIKSDKSKMIKLSGDDKLIAAIPIYGKPSGYIAAWTNDKLYHTQISEYPTLKRMATGNRVLKLTNSQLINAQWLPEEASHWIIYSESGYMKEIHTSILTPNKKKPQSINMDNHTIYGVIPLINDRASVVLYDFKMGATSVEIESGKMVQLTINNNGKQDHCRFKISTSIASPVKVLKQGRNQFYQFI